jgi:hypothetical protein
MSPAPQVQTLVLPFPLTDADPTIRPDVCWCELARVGTFESPAGFLALSAQDLRSIAASFTAPVVIDFDHRSLNPRGIGDGTCCGEWAQNSKRCATHLWGSEHGDPRGTF